MDRFKLEEKFKSEISSWNINNHKILLSKAQTYMNLTWESLNKIINFYKIDKKDIIVIYDDLSMEFWKVRIRDKWSDGWHNWIKNIISYIWVDFLRIKIWIWYNPNYLISDWVLSKFNDEEYNKLEAEVFLKVYNILKNNNILNN